MEKFTTLSGVAAPLNMVNVDTDKIVPKQFLQTIQRTGLGRYLFNDLRYDDQGAERPDFVLNREPYRHAAFLVAGENFGCGSSREHAPWALQDFGIRCVIAPSFADIFFNNCFKNGMLPITLDQASIATLMADAEAGAELVVDLERQIIHRSGNQTLAFDVEPFRKHCLLDGLDDIGLTLERTEAIDAFEKGHKASHPWLYG